MTSTHKIDNVSSPSTPGSSVGTSGHKNSLKSSKLARRARSFKEMKDGLFEKISQIRTPTNTLIRSHSPLQRRCRDNRNTEEVKPIDTLEKHVRDIKNALKHFKDVISKKKYEVLSGNGTIIIELANNMCLALQSQIESQTLQSALNQVYLSLAKLLKLCDEILVCEDVNDCASLNDENVKEIVCLVENAVQNLFNVAVEKIQDKENTSSTSNTLCKPTIDTAGQRTSLPDIPLTPIERDILEKSCPNPMRASHSTESILRDSSPPPKPPLPISSRKTNPPPLPPKRRINQRTQNECNSDSTMHLGIGVDQLSLRSKSPDDNSSLLSASAGSLDSAFNHSREEEELKAIAMETSFEDKQFLENEMNMAFSLNPNTSNKKMEKNISFPENSENKDNRRSNESGFVSIQSLRASTQSGGSSTKRSSGQSIQSQRSNQLTSLNNIDNLSISTTTSSNNSTKYETYQQNEEHQHQKQKSLTTIINSTGCDQNISQQQLLQRQQQLTTSSNTLTTINSKQSITSTMKSQQSISSSSSSSFSTNFSQKEFSSNNAEVLNDFQQKNLVKKQLNYCLNSLSNENSITNNNIDKNFISSLQTQLSAASTINDEHLLENNDELDRSISPLSPPALPAKTKNKRENTFFPFDKKADDLGFTHTDFPRSTSTTNFTDKKHHSLIDNPWGEVPPPLPAKKKHIIAYMEICSASSRSSTDALRHSVHTYNISSNSSDFTSPNRSIIHSQTMNLQSIKHQFAQNLKTIESDEKPPALPPKRQPKINSCRTPTIITTPPESPKPSCLYTENKSVNNININNSSNETSRSKKILTNNQITEMSTVSEETNENLLDEQQQQQNQIKQQIKRNQNNLQNLSSIDNDNDDDDDEVILRNNSGLTPEKLPSSPSHSLNDEAYINLMEEIDVTDYLVLKKEGEDGPDIKGGYLDALIVYASKLHKNNENAFGEAFITTFRTFIQPVELIRKLIHRYNVFICETQKKKIARETYSLLYRVVNDLTACDIDPNLYSILMEFVYNLVSTGELPDAKIIRNKIVEKIILYKRLKYGTNIYEQQRNIVTNQPTLLDLKSCEIAEQMTLLDAELFQKIEIPEILLFAKDQCDEKTPNLNKFTEHFNKMSYWARSQIIKQDDAKDREKYVVKFIKIMKNLRKMNNYNSYLALLSALDSGPIRRLEWHKTITEGLKEYCALIDSSLGFRVYRQALADTNSPCIPYIGLVLQDLTFVHVGNPDYLKSGVINFSKRWQQHNIIVNMKRFKSCAYPFKRSEKIIQFFENFENFLGEEQMWQISENIKPRGRRPINN